MSEAAEGPVDLAGVAAMCGLTYRTVLVYRHQGLLPEPDGYVARSPWWHAASIRAWNESRPVPSRQAN